MLSKIHISLIKKAAIFSGFFCAFSIQIFANDFDLNTNIKEAYQNTFAFKINESKAILAKETSKNGLRVYIENLNDILTILLTDDDKLKVKLANKEDQRLQFINQLDDKSPFKKLILAEIRFHWAVVKLNNGEEVAAAWNVIKAYKLLVENQKQFPDFLPTKKMLGLLHILIGTTPEQYKWVTKLIGVEGDINLGLKELRQVAKSDWIFAMEASIFEVYLNNFILQKNEIGLSNFNQLLRQNPNNNLIKYLGVSVFLKNNQAESAKRVLNLKQNEIAFQLPGYQRYEGEILLYEGKYDEAILAFNSFLNQSKGNAYHKDILQKISFCNIIKGNKKEAEKAILKIKSVGNTFKEKDKLAQSFATEWIKTKRFPNQDLLKAKLSFDGGFFKKSFDELSILAENDFKIIEEKIEYNYRMGRILHQNNEPKKALIYYDRAILLSENMTLYFGANAALQAGYMLKTQNPKLAKAYFLKAISFKKHPYKTSIDAKAKAALAMEK